MAATFEAVIVSAEFAGKNRVQRQQRVNAVLKGRNSGELHALSMKTLTPDGPRRGKRNVDKLIITGGMPLSAKSPCPAPRTPRCRFSARRC